MALYIGSNKVNIVLNGKLYYVNMSSSTHITIGKKISLLNDEILKDINGQYITLKKETTYE